ncbi:hypothetical protein KFK09_010651 [Dendrobium nobile]|uniref:Uncharacterized protein n=1 Tax=Dendrobium nobile TaxID=94219 RepID=A0A8T3BDC3_DENNO|nr:hypothetical protein KFK09_010651 [Dendrobium nobile]
MGKSPSGADAVKLYLFDDLIRDVLAFPFSPGFVSLVLLASYIFSLWRLEAALLLSIYPNWFLSAILILQASFRQG